MPSSPIPARSPARSACSAARSCCAACGSWLGVHWDGVKAGANADIDSANTPFSPAGWKHLEASLDRIYADFLRRVAAGPQAGAARPRAAVAKGQIWTGADARERGLVDELGGLSTAIRLARSAAGVPVDAAVRIEQFPAPESGLGLVMRHLVEASLVEVGPRPDDRRLSHRLGDIAAHPDGGDGGVDDPAPAAAAPALSSGILRPAAPRSETRDCPRGR